jgi:hypothetical protein
MTGDHREMTIKAPLLARRTKIQILCLFLIFLATGSASATTAEAPVSVYTVDPYLISKAIQLSSKTPYTPINGESSILSSVGSLMVMPSDSVVYLDEAKIAIKAYNIGGNNYYNLDDLFSVLN